MSIAKLREQLEETEKKEIAQELWRREGSYYLGDTRINEERYRELRRERGSGSRVNFVFE